MCLRDIIVVDNSIFPLTPVLAEFRSMPELNTVYG